MITMIQYKVKADKADENARYIEGVFKELHEAQPEYFHYASFRDKDEVHFTHIVKSKDEMQSDILGDLPAFKKFLEKIKERCEVQPRATQIDEVGSYGFFNIQVDA